ncbi:MAG: hypothetical protein HY825_00525 [Acidobacteria bacterium]|nr:hypothetical protein [Acidobacteriota bacterium]
MISLGRLAGARWASVQRGGSWQGDANCRRPAQRHKHDPDSLDHGIPGFRLARSE